MNTVWFRFKFALLILLACTVGAFLMPQNITQYFPEPIQSAVQNSDFKLGIDLAGGTQLEYAVDFSEAEKKADLSENPEPINKQQIANGVVDTLKKRVDPDGTKEVKAFASERGEQWLVTVELTADIDTPENRAKLEKVTSLAFLDRGTNESISSVLQSFSEEDSFQNIAQNLTNEGKGYANPFDIVDRESLAATIGTQNADNVFFSITKESEGKWISQGFSIPESPYHIMILYVENVSDDEQTFIIKSFAYKQWNDTGLGGAQFDTAKVSTDPNTGYPVTTINFNTEGQALFGKMTGEISKRTSRECGQGDIFAIAVDNSIISSPCVSERIDGNAQISFGNSGNFQTVNIEANELADNLNSGATPAPVSLISERTISASLGERALELSVKAALLGFIAVAIWMAWFYRFFGILAILALIFYAAVLLVLFKSFGFVLTLSGIAGVILSIGMAVDANVLIFERIREELRDGNSFNNAVSEGFDRAWDSIRDSNISSLIVCFILYMSNISIVMNFAITLGMGILVSMFTAIVFTRYLVTGLTPKWMQEKISAMVGE